MKYTVFVDDNYHHTDASYRYELGKFATYDEAIVASKKIVDEFLNSSYKKGMSAKELYDSFTQYGEDPFISPDEEKFSAWEYAKIRAEELCTQKG